MTIPKRNNRKRANMIKGKQKQLKSENDKWKKDDTEKGHVGKETTGI